MKKTTSVFLFFISFCIMISLTAGTTETKQNEVTVKISTNFGDIKLKLFNETPLHRDNFIKLIKKGYYDGTIFHRVMKQFMIQGGDPDSKNAASGTALGQGNPGYTIPAEFSDKYFHKKGALAAARLSDAINPKKESSGCQFYIVQGNKYSIDILNKIAKQTGKFFSKEQIDAYTTIGGAPHLDGEYTIFGEVIEGLDVVDKIANVATDRRSRPIEDIKITVQIISE